MNLILTGLMGSGKTTIGKLVAQKIVQDVAEIAGCKESSVSVAIEEVPQEEWMSKVYDEEIIGNQENLIIKPGYGSLSED